MRASLVALVLCLLPALQAASVDWVPVVRPGEIVPGSDPPIVIDGLRGGFEGTIDDSLVVLADGRVLLSLASDLDFVGLFRWSPTDGLVRLVAPGDAIGEDDPLAVRRMGIAAAHPSGLAALRFSTAGRLEPQSIAVLDEAEQIRLEHRWSDFEAIVPGAGALEGPTVVGIDEQGRTALGLSRAGNTHLLAPDEGGELQVVAHVGGPAPGEPDSEIRWLDASYSGALGIHAEIEVAPGASPSGGRGVFRWTPSTGFSTVTRIEWGVDEFENIEEFQGDSSGALTWLACCGGPEGGQAIFQSIGGGAPVPLLVEGHPVPGGPPGAIANGIWELVTGTSGRVAAQIEYRFSDDYRIGVVASTAAGPAVLRLSEGRAVPGRPGWTYGQARPRAIGSDGALALSAELRDPQGDSAGTQYLIARPNGQLVPLFADGDVVEIAPGDSRVVEELDGIRVDPDLEHVAVALLFDAPPGGSAIFFTTVPEPTGAAVAASAAIASLAARRRTRGGAC